MANFFIEVYNQDIKERFLNEIDLAKYPDRWWERLFEKSRLFESKHGKDFCCFTTVEILEFYKFLEVSSLEFLNVYNLNLIKYGDWALANGLIYDGQNHFSEIDFKVLTNCVAKGALYQSILTYDQLNEACRRLQNYQDRYILYCLFEGIKGRWYDEILNLKLSDIDTANNTVALCSGRTILVTDTFISVCNNANEETTYVRTDDKILPLKQCDTIYKEKNNSRGNALNRAIYASITRSIDMAGLGESVSGNSIFNSGLIYYLNKRADALKISVRELLNDLDKCQDIIDKYNFNMGVKSTFLIKYENFLK